MGSVFEPFRFLHPVCRLCWFLYTLNIYAHFSSHFSQQLLMAEIWYLVTSFIFFLQSSNIYKLYNNILKFSVLSIALTRTNIILPIVKEILVTPMKKTYNLNQIKNVENGYWIFFGDPMNNFIRKLNYKLCLWHHLHVIIFFTRRLWSRVLHKWIKLSALWIWSIPTKQTPENVFELFNQSKHQYHSF